MDMLKKGLGIRNGKGLLIKIAGMSAIFVLLAILVLAIISTFSLQSTSREVAFLIGKKKLSGDMKSLEAMLELYYGHVTMSNGQLVDQHGNSIHHQYRLVDRISEDLGIVATIFVRDGNDFRRISTSITDTSGNRAVDTLLGVNHVAYSTIMEGRYFIGSARIFGIDYYTEYRPLFAPNGRDIIGCLFIGMEMDTIYEAINENTSTAIQLLSVIALVILLLSIILNTISCKFIVIKPIKQVVDMLKEISEGEGDLTRKLSVSSKDEIGSLAHYFNNTLEKIKNMVVKVKAETITLSGIGNDLASNMNETAAAVNEITANIQSIKSRVINQSASVSETN
ncbi:MAG: Cache 3/Cache 2 fusion domain-containing protein, partial [Spirochaetaceae bacterium]|nr:Cache 3/Cache 2 fusion domain-containing protein [Spirochaetaceae bacterium]